MHYSAWNYCPSTFIFLCMENVSLQERLGRSIVLLRKGRHISQEKLALEAGVDRRYLSDVENGKRNISIEMIERFVGYFDMKISEFFTIAESIGLEYKSVKDLKRSLKDSGFENAVVFEKPDYLDAVIGVSENGRVIYSREKMVRSLMVKEGMSAEDAVEFVEYNTMGALPNAGEMAPIVMDELK